MPITDSPLKSGSIVACAALTATIALLAASCHSVAANGAIVGQVLAGRGTASREAAHPGGIAGQQVVVVDALRGNVAATATTDSDGSFQMSVPAGSYVVQSVNTRQYVRVTAGEELRVYLMAPVP